MTIAMTARQQEELNGRGFTVIEALLGPSELEVVSTAMDQVAESVRSARGLSPDESLSLRNGIARHEALLDLVDHPLVLPLVVDAMGWNIQNRDSVFDYKAPLAADCDPGELALGWHFDYEEEFAGTTVDGVMPLLDFKVGWYVSDHSEPGHSTILLVPGSFRWNAEQRATWETRVDPADIFELRVPAGSVMLWRPTLLHSVTPNQSKKFRKSLYVSYGPRWVRPSGYLDQDPDLVERSSPIRRQLLGAMGDGSNRLGADPVNGPSSQYWFSDRWDSVPLRAWAMEQAGAKTHDWGLGFGATHTKGPGFEFTQKKVPVR